MDLVGKHYANYVIHQDIQDQLLIYSQLNNFQHFQIYSNF